MLSDTTHALEFSQEELGRHCGFDTIGDMLVSGWKVHSEGYIAAIGNRFFVLEDGSIYKADMTVGIFKGDHAIILSQFVRTEKTSGFIYNLCAGGFDAWVTPKN